MGNMETGIGRPNGSETWTNKLGLRTNPISPAVYTDPKQFELERDLIFRRYWLNLGRVSDIPKAGDYVVHDIPFLPVSVLLIRGKDGEVRAFHNACTHRGNKICQKFADKTSFFKSGNKAFFMCEFHGWVFNDKGDLVDIPDERNFFDIDRKSLGMVRIHSAIWEGFIFINLAETPEFSLEEQLGEVKDQLAGYPFDAFSPIFGYEGDVGCNWKLSVDSQVEGYHAVTLHRRTLGNSLGGAENPMIHMLDVAAFGENHRLSMPAGSSPDRGPVDALAARFGPSIRSYDGGKLTEMPKGVNPTRSDKWAADIYFIFPNFWIALFNGQYQTHNFWPLEVGRMYQRINMYGTPAETAAQAFAIEYARVMSSNVWLEDFSTLEDCQAIAQSGAIKQLHFQDQEVLCRRFHERIEAIIRQPAGWGGAD